MAKTYDGYEVVVALLNVIDSCAVALQEVGKAYGVYAPYTRIYESAMETVQIMEKQIMQIKEKSNGD